MPAAAVGYQSKKKTLLGMLPIFHGSKFSMNSYFYDIICAKDKQKFVSKKIDNQARSVKEVKGKWPGLIGMVRLDCID